MTKFEKKAALAVAAATVGVVVSGLALLRKHNKYMAKKAAATFGSDDDDMDFGDFFDDKDKAKAKADQEAMEAAKQRKLMRLKRQNQVKLTRLQERKLMRQGRLDQKKRMRVR